MIERRGGLFLVDTPLNPDFGVFGPDPFFEHHYKHGGVWHGNTELPVSLVLYSLALANRAQVIVETGVNNGAGATLWLAFAATANGGAYHGVDIDKDAVARAQAALVASIPNARYTFYKGNALDILPAHFQPDTIDLIFVDDDHHKAQVEQEIETFLPLVRPGGLMCFHDVLGVHEADVWEPLKARGGMRLVTHAHLPNKPFGGLGILQRA